MNWHDLKDPDGPELDALASKYNLHPLHVEDCRHGNQRAKVEEGTNYIFVVLKPVHVSEAGELSITELDLFLGPDYLITVMEGDCPSVRSYLNQLHGIENRVRPDQLFYKIADGIVDAYAPTLDWFNELIDGIEDAILDEPSPATLQRILDSKRNLVGLRRALSNMRDVASHLQRLETDLIRQDLWPYLRDLFDHLARNMDTVDVQRDLLTGAMDVYLSSVANRTNQVMKVLTVLGTIALPSIVISGMYGMNTQGLPWVNAAYGSEMVVGVMTLATLGLLFLLRKFHWF